MASRPARWLPRSPPHRAQCCGVGGSTGFEGLKSGRGGFSRSVTGALSRRPRHALMAGRDPKTEQEEGFPGEPLGVLIVRMAAAPWWTTSAAAARMASSDAAARAAGIVSAVPPSRAARQPTSSSSIGPGPISSQQRAAIPRASEPLPRKPSASRLRHSLRA